MSKAFSKIAAPEERDVVGGDLARGNKRKQMIKDFLKARERITEGLEEKDNTMEIIMKSHKGYLFGMKGF